MPRAKIVGNMMEWKKPTSTMAQTAMWPVVRITSRRQTTEENPKRASTEERERFS